MGSLGTPMSFLLGGLDPVFTIDGATDPGYPDYGTTDVFSEVYLSRVYAKNLGALELASSGKISLALNDVTALDISRSVEGVDSGDVVALAAQGASGISLVAASDAASIYLSAASSNIYMDSAHDIYLTCSNNIYMNAQNLIINVANMTTSYAFAVAESGELQLQQSSPNADGSRSKRIVARFGIKSALAPIATDRVMTLL